MNKNVIIVLIGAVIVAVLMAVLVQMMLGDKKEEVVAVKEEPKSEILIAAKDLGIGRELREGDLKWQTWPKNNLFAGAIVRKESQSPEEALEGRLRRDVAEGEPVMASYMLGQTKGNLVAASLEPGQRAVSIQVSATTMVAGFLAPGDFVDVILTYQQSVTVEGDDPLLKEVVRQGLNRTAVETILENVKVLAVDQSAQRSAEEERIKVGKTVTLALDVEETEKIVLAQQMGALTLVLRGVGDDAPIQRKWPITSDARLVNADDEILAEYQKLKNESGIQTNNVRIYSGGAVQVVPSN
ncbi:MAG: Flp pilus assembly protein CpaB [Micavibrio sp.]|nr:Flp pilus assembly protein CpaB [Micavibrio sp.]|tara:strand:- start:552 stop:1445 length:894 start_codon:yes stop_codon:yes gene_type:complete